MRVAPAQFVDDNITLDTDRFEALCRAIIAAGLNRIDYFVQAMTASIATHGETLAPLMREAGFRYVFLGIENILDEDLAFLKARQEQPAPCGHTDQYRGCSDRPFASPRHARRRRPHRRQSGRSARVDCRKPHVRQALHRLAVYPASDAVSCTPMTADFEQKNLIVNRRLEEPTAPRP